MAVFLAISAIVVIAAGGATTQLVLYYAVPVFVSFLPGLLAMTGFSRRERNRAGSQPHLLGPRRVHDLENLPRGYPLASLAAARTIGLIPHRFWVRQSSAERHRQTSRRNASTNTSVRQRDAYLRPPSEYVPVSRSQRLVLTFFAAVWLSLVAILYSAPEVYDEILRSPARDRVAEVAFLSAITVLLGVLAVAVIRRWRWAFWLILIAFIAGALRIPVSALQLSGVLRTAFPEWYIVFQGVIGLVQAGIGMVMLLDCRKAGVWGPSNNRTP